MGLVLYEMLTLARPFSSSTREGILRQIMTKAMVPLSWKNKAVPRALESIVHKAVTKDPEERYTTADAFADDLQHYLCGKPVSATPYQYRFDDNALIAEGPGGVTFVSFVVFLLICMLIYKLCISISLLIVDVNLGRYINYYIYSIPFDSLAIFALYRLGR